VSSTSHVFNSVHDKYILQLGAEPATIAFSLLILKAAIFITVHGSCAAKHHCISTTSQKEVVGEDGDA